MLDGLPSRRAVERSLGRTLDASASEMRWLGCTARSGGSAVPAPPFKPIRQPVLQKYFENEFEDHRIADHIERVCAGNDIVEAVETLVGNGRRSRSPARPGSGR